MTSMWYKRSIKMGVAKVDIRFCLLKSENTRNNGIQFDYTKATCCNDQLVRHEA